MKFELIDCYTKIFEFIKSFRIYQYFKIFLINIRTNYVFKKFINKKKFYLKDLILRLILLNAF
jgi:hypothetical protein